jgi:hypothetical protein
MRQDGVGRNLFLSNKLLQLPGSGVEQAHVVAVVKERAAPMVDVKRIDMLGMVGVEDVRLGGCGEVRILGPWD